MRMPENEDSIVELVNSLTTAKKSAIILRESGDWMKNMSIIPLFIQAKTLFNNLFLIAFKIHIVCFSSSCFLLK